MPTWINRVSPGDRLEAMVTRVGSATPWRGQSDTTRRALIGAIAVSAVLHVPLTHFAAIFGLLGFLAAPPEDPDPIETINAIPIDLLEDLGSEEEEKPAEPEATEPAAAEEEDPFEALDFDDPPVKPKPKPEPERDAGAPVDAGGDAAEEESADGGTDAGPLAKDAGPAARDAGAKISDPVAAAGPASSVVDSNANVRLRIHTNRIRSHPLAARIGAAMGSTYQWRDFFGPAGLDPVADIDSILIVGPQFRDSSQVAVILEHGVGKAKMKKALNALVERSGEQGRWGKASGLAVATVFADRASRSFFLPNDRVVVMTPPSAQDTIGKQLAGAGAKFRLKPPTGKEAVSAYLVTPWRAARGFRSPIQVPKSFKWLRLEVTIVPSGASVRLEAEDESVEMAKTNAEDLTRQVDAIIAQVGIFQAVTGKIDRVRFRAKGKRVTATARATNKQLRLLMSFAEEEIRRLDRKRRASDKKPKKPDAPPKKSGGAEVPKGTSPANPAKPPDAPPSPPAAPAPAQDEAPPGGG